MKPLKICMVTTFYPPFNFGGDGVYVYRMTNALARQGHEVHVIHDVDAFSLLNEHKPRPAAPNHPNVTLYPLSSSGFGPVDMILQHQFGRPIVKRGELKTILEKTGFDVIHFHNISLVGGPHVLKYGNAIKLCSMHDYWFVCATHVLWRFNEAACDQRTCLACTLKARRPPQLWRYDGTLKRISNHVDAFIGASHFTREKHIANGFPAPIRYLPYFLPDDHWQKNAPQSPEDYPPPTQRPYFLYVGRLEKIKGVQVLLEIFRNYREADLVIAGVGTYEQELRAMAAGLNHVHFTGFLGQDHLAALYQNSICTIVPSICFETFGWITLEAFAMRTPVIVNEMGALPEVVRMGGGGLVYRNPHELVEAMETLRTQPNLRQEMGAQGYQNYLDHFTEEQHMKMYFGMIDEIRAAREAR